MKRLKNILLILLTICVAIAIVITFARAGLKKQMEKIPALSFEDTIEYSLKGNESGKISVGIIQDGKSSYKVYGTDGKEVESELYDYEIGSITKTMTAALVAEAIEEGLVELDAQIDEYLDLPEGDYPSIQQLLTHTSGYAGYYFEGPMIGNFLGGRNSFYQITEEMILDKLAKKNPGADPKDFEYSNFGFATLGLILESVYETEYTELLTTFLHEKIELKDTVISQGAEQPGNLENYWTWQEGDAYISAGAVVSNIEDMLRYLEFQIEGREAENIFATCHEPLEEINVQGERFELLDINMDKMGMAWVIDQENGFIWHNGGTGNFNSYMAFHPESNTGVVILSNLKPSEKIPATVSGIKLLKELVKEAEPGK